MLRRIALLTLVFTLFTFGVTAQTAKKINYPKEGYVKAKVIKYEVENCGFLIELTDKEKTKLMPDKLTDEFKKNNQKIWVKYLVAKKQMMSNCMAGKQSEIIDIKKRK